MEEHDIETVPALSSVKVPLYALKGALACSSDEETRFYLNGVYIHRIEQSIRVAGTDGKRLFVCMIEQGDMELPAWLDAGVIIPRDELKPRLSFLDKLKEGTAVISFAPGAAKVVLSNANDDTVFRMEPVNGTFPDYQTGVIDKTHGAFTREASADFEAVGYDAGYLKEVGAIAKVLDSDYVRVFSSTAGEPSVITFDSAPGVILYLMPSTIKTALAPQTAKLLEGPIKGTIAALKAHQTRWQQRYDDLPGTAPESEREAIQIKIEEYVLRIANVIKQANPPALPSPFESFNLELKRRISAEDYQLAEPHVQGWVDDGVSVDVAIAAVEELAAAAAEEANRRAEELDGRQPLIEERAALGIKKRKTASREFLKDVRIDLASRHLDGNLANAGDVESHFTNGFTVEEVVARIIEAEGLKDTGTGQPGTLESFTAEVDQLLAGGKGVLSVSELPAEVPIADWFDAGLTPAEAAVRCVEWVSVEQAPEDGIKEPAPRPEHVGDFVEAVMTGLIARVGDLVKPTRRKVTAAATSGFAGALEVNQVVDDVIENAAHYGITIPAIEYADAAE